MTDSRPTTSPEQEANQQVGDSHVYLYGIGLVPTELDRDVLQEVVDQAGIQVRFAGELAAFIREAPASEFSEETLNARMQDQEWLMRQVQHHHHVVAAIANQLPLLPATFGTLYATEESLLASLRGDAELLRGRLERIAGCDEWALHMYQIESGIRELVLEEDAELRRMSEDLKDAQPGRAYLMGQQLERRLTRAVEERQLATAESVLNDIRRFARDIQLEEPRSETGPTQEDTEVVRAALLVPRETSEELLDTLNRVAEAVPGVRVEVSGPWPVYSFARNEPEDT